MMTKKCNGCKLIKPKSGFHKNKAKKDGLSHLCKECKKKTDIKYYSKNKQRLLVKQREWRENNPEKQKAIIKKYYETNKEKTLARKKEYHKKHLKESRARASLGYAVRSGKIKKPESCDSCSEIKPLDGHHKDYNKPLEVTWLCRGCHSLTG